MFWRPGPAQHGPVPSNHSAIGGLASAAAPSSPPHTAQTTVRELLTNWSELATPQFIAQPWTQVKQQQNIKAHKRKREHSQFLSLLAVSSPPLSFFHSLVLDPLTLNSRLLLSTAHTHTVIRGGVCATSRLSHCVMFRNQSGVKLTPSNELFSEVRLSHVLQAASAKDTNAQEAQCRDVRWRKRVDWRNERASWSLMDMETETVCSGRTKGRRDGDRWKRGKQGWGH